MSKPKPRRSLPVRLKVELAGDEIQQVPIDAIHTHGGTQMRAGLNYVTLDEYTDWLLELFARDALAEMPPLHVYYDGQEYWLADGFHRLNAWTRSRPDGGDMPDAIQCIVHAGTRRDAILHAAGANAEHGLRRTNADKRRAVTTLLRDEEWTAWSDAEIGRRCRVDSKTVGNIRRELVAGGEIDDITTRRTTDGRVIDTGNIGGNQPKRTNAEKRSAVAAMLLHDEWREWSDSEIARRCGVDAKTVGNIRRELVASREIPDSINRKTSDNRLMDTNNIGGRDAAVVLDPTEQAIIDRAAGWVNVVYVLRNSAGHCKIGYSTSLGQRYRGSYAVDPQVKLIHAFQADRSVEMQLHRIFAPMRLSGEWFDLDQKSVDWLLTLYSWVQVRERAVADAAEIGAIAKPEPERDEDEEIRRYKDAVQRRRSLEAAGRQRQEPQVAPEPPAAVGLNRDWSREELDEYERANEVVTSDARRADLTNRFQVLDQLDTVYRNARSHLTWYEHQTGDFDARRHLEAVVDDMLAKLAELRRALTEDAPDSE